VETPELEVFHSVYASGDGLQSDTKPRLPAVAVRIVADADVDVLARIANVMLLANTPPWHVLLRTIGTQVHVEIELRDVEHAMTERICRKLAQLTCVTGIEMRLRD
jgi:hypothetical protein